MSDSSRSQIYYLAESTWGVTPASPMTALRFISETLKHENVGKESEEVRSDSQITDYIRTNVQASQAVNYELSYAALDSFFAAALRTSFGATVNFSGTDISFANSDNSLNSTTTTFTGKNLVVGGWIKVTGSTSGLNDKYFEVVSIATNKVVVRGNTVTTQAASPSITVKGTSIQNGTTATSFVLEKAFADTGDFVSFNGMRVNELSLSAMAGEVVKGSMSFLGLKGVPAGATVGTGGAVAAPTNNVLNCTDNSAGIWENYVSTGIVFQSFDFKVQNDLRVQPAVGVLGPSGIGYGSFKVTGSLKAYFANRTLYQKYTNNTVSALAFTVIDNLNQGYTFSFPRIEYTDGDVVAPNKATDIFTELQWQAVMDPTIGKTMNITRYA